jgi:hypothetical protein
MNIADALISLYRGVDWEIVGGTYDGLNWKSTTVSKPTEQELLNELVRLQAEYAAKEYQHKRAAEYPSVADQFETLYHGGYDAWKATIDSVKAKYPQP